MSNLRIAYLSHSYPPVLSGVSTVVHNLAEGMPSLGHECMAIVSSDIGKPYQEHGQVDVLRLRSFPTPKPIDYRFMPFPSRKISQELAQFDPDIVHVHDPILARLAVKIKIEQEPSWPLIYSVHLQPGAVIPHIPDILGFRDFLENVMIKYGRQLIDCCQAIISPSVFLAGYIREQTGNDVHVISNGVDTDHFKPSPTSPVEPLHLREKYHLHPTLPILLSVGRLSEEKNLDIVLRTAAIVMQQTEAQLVVVGDGNTREDLQSLADDLGIGEKTTFTGPIEREVDLPGMFRLAEVFLMASEVEAQGLVVLEALATGIPVVAVRASAIPELVTDGSNGFLVPPQDPGAMADKVHALLNDKELAGEIRINARESIRHHSLDTTLILHQNLYHSVLEKALIKT